MIIFRYFAKEVFGTLIITMLILMVLFITNQSLQFLDRAANGEIPATVLLQLVMLQIPLLLGYLIPLGLYLGLLLTIGRWCLSSEMTVLFACGMSRLKLTTYVMTIALFIAALVLWLMAQVVPIAQGKINRIFSRAQVSATVSKVIPNRFMTIDKSNIVFYASSITNHAIMHQVFFAERLKSSVKNTEKWAVVRAQSAFEEYLLKEHGQYLIFNNGYRYEGAPGQKAFDVTHFKIYGVRLNKPILKNVNKVQYETLSQLFSQYHRDKNAAAEFQWRLAMPISALIFALLAMPLGEIKPRYGKLTQLFPALLIYLIYADLIFLTRSWIRAGKISIGWGMWWVHLFPLTIAIILIGYRAGYRRIGLMFNKVVG